MSLMSLFSPGFGGRCRAVAGVGVGVGGGGGVGVVVGGGGARASRSCRQATALLPNPLC